LNLPITRTLYEQSRPINAAEDVYYFDRQQSRQFNDLDDVDARYLVAGYSPEKAVARGVYAQKVARAARAEAVSCP
jgi:hypothetical protein